MLADPNATLGQVNFMSTLDQGVSSMTLTEGSLGITAGTGPEIRDTNVAYQPFSNTAVLFNPQLNQVSLIDPVRLQRLQIIPTAPASGPATNGIGIVNVPGGTGTVPLSIFGALAVDAATNTALVVNSGSNNISVVTLGTNIKPVQLSR